MEFFTQLVITFFVKNTFLDHFFLTGSKLNKTNELLQKIIYQSKVHFGNWQNNKQFYFPKH
jgi:hypothetical protein